MSAKRAAQQLGRLGGRARARRLSTDRVRAIASLGGQARAMSWLRARRIAENFRYVDALCALQGHAAVTTVRHVRRCQTPLPNTHAKTKIGN